MKYIKVTHLEIRAEVLGDEWAVALRQHHDLLLDILDLIFSFFEIDDLDGDDLLRAVVDAFEHLAERTLADLFLLCEDKLRIHLLQNKKY